MSDDVARQWRDAFWKVLRHHEHSRPLKRASLEEHLGEWTKQLTWSSVETCRSLGWRAAAKGHRLDLLPEPQYEYLSLDIMAFREAETRWVFPTAVLELENSRKNDRIAYSLWKLLCVRSDLRIVFCYRRTHDAVSELLKILERDVIAAMGSQNLLHLPGQTMLVIGSRSDSDTFPNGFFRWRILDANTSKFVSF